MDIAIPESGLDARHLLGVAWERLVNIHGENPRAQHVEILGVVCDNLFGPAMFSPPMKNSFPIENQIMDMEVRP